MELDAEGNLFVAGDFSTLLQPDDSHSMPLDMPMDPDVLDRAFQIGTRFRDC